MTKDIEQILNPLGINSLTPIQNEVLSQYEQFQEIILYAPTGTGKTLAFLLPLIQLLRKKPIKNTTQAVIISPTRELAIQIENVFKSLKTEFTINSCYGGHALDSEINNLSQNPHVIVGTPGRLMDHIERETLKMFAINILVFDEFDKCLEMGFLNEIEHIYGETRQLEKLFFGSATHLRNFPNFIKLANPIFIDKTSNELQPKIDYFHVRNQESKLNTLKDLIIQFQLDRAIVFCNFREDVESISIWLDKNQITHSAYHGGLEQDERERALIKFRNNTSPILVCTDIGARGLDIADVKHIVHYMLPDKEDAFIHRNGRTARMLESGKVYIFNDDIARAKFDLPATTEFRFDKSLTYQRSNWITIYFSGGKKNKINKIDLVGFLCKNGSLPKESIGLITVLDYTSYVGISTNEPKKLITKLRESKIKGQKLKIDLAY